MLNALAEEIERRKCDPTLSKYQRSDPGINEWVTNAIKLGGAALYDEPDIIDVRTIPTCAHS